MVSKAGEPANVVNKLISKDGVVAVLGEVASSRSLEAAPICQQNSIPMITPASTNAKVTETGDYIFRMCFIDPFQGTVMANFATNTLKSGTQMIGRENGKTGTISKRGGTQRRGGGPDPLTGECLAGALGTVLATKTMPLHACTRCSGRCVAAAELHA